MKPVYDSNQSGDSRGKQILQGFPARCHEIFSRKGRAVRVLFLVLLFVLLPLTATRVYAADAWALAAQALGVYAAYQSTLSTLMAYGADPGQQVLNARQDARQNGIDTNENDIRAVNQVMDALVTKSDYALRPNSLPFTWQVTGDKMFNAACYPTDYISVNKGLVRILHLNEDELAAVLGHEMTHGISQHAAKDYAKAVAVYYGMSFLNMSYGLMDWNKLNGLAGYSIAKNITLPSEYDADEGGFHLMTEAGFNPGGPAAAMARMAYYMTYETRDTNEYEDPDKVGEDNMSDHPETKLREKRLSDMMTAYSAGHVTVESGKTVCIDRQPLLTVDWKSYDYDDTAENAYLVAGGLAKAFHDHDSIDGWDFRGDDFLDGSRVYTLLKDFVSSTGRLGKLQELVAAAYAGEPASGARTKMKADESAYRADIQKKRDDIAALDEKNASKIIAGSDAFIDYGEPASALRLLARVYPGPGVTKPEQEAAALAVRGRAKAALGQYAEGLADCDRSVSLDSKTVNNYLDRADARRMAGDRAGTLSDALAAADKEKKNATAVFFVAEIYDEMDDAANAMEWYRKYYKLKPDAFRSIPQTYLKTISERDWKTVEKEKEEREKKLLKDQGITKPDKDGKAGKADKADQADKAEQADGTIAKTRLRRPNGLDSTSL